MVQRCGDRSGFRALVLAVVLAAAHAATAGAAGEVVSYDIRVSLDPAAHRLEGAQRLRWTNTTAATTAELRFHLYLNAFAGPGTTFMRELEPGPLHDGPPEEGWGWIRIDRLRLDDGSDLLPGLEFVQPDDGNPDDRTVARVPLPREVPPGDAVELEIAFTARLPQVVSRTGFAGDFHLAGQWFPKLGVFEGERGWSCHQFHADSEFYADFGSYRLAVTVPSGWVVAASGVELGRETGGDGRDTLRFRADRVHDVAWCAAPPELMDVVESDFEPGRDVPPAWLARARARLGLSTAELELPPMALRLVLPRAQRALAPRMLRAARLAVAWFGLHYGAYPYPQLTVVSPPPQAAAAGAMEYPTFITTGADSLHAWPPFSWSSAIESVTAHEFGHQYFQGILASNEFQEAWLDEGLASYAEIACLTDIAADRLVPEIRGYSYWSAERFALAQASLPVTPGTKAWEFPDGESYYLGSYTKTALALKTVEGLVGAEALARGLRAYVVRHAFGHPTGRDLVAVLGERAGRDLRPFFEQAIWGDAEADWGVTGVRQRERRAAAGSAPNGPAAQPAGDPEGDAAPWLVEVDLVRRGGFVGPVEVELGWADGSYERRTWDGDEASVSWRIGSERRLRQVVVDPDGVWVLETRRADNYWRDRPLRSSQPLWWVREALALAGRLLLRMA